MLDQKTVKVKNISERALHLLNGRILPGKEGLATIAETQNHPDHMEIVKEPVKDPVKPAVAK